MHKVNRLIVRLPSLTQVRLASNTVEICGRRFERDEMTNVTPAIVSKVGRGLLHTPNHPLKIIKQAIEGHFDQYKLKDGRKVFTSFDNISPIVNTRQNFDSLLIPADHPSRSRNDNYYINKDTMLRAHTSAHQTEFIGQGHPGFLLSGDVYRRDEIDRSHYPVFHQMEGVRMFTRDELAGLMSVPVTSVFESTDRTPTKQEAHTQQTADFIAAHLKESLTGMVRRVFGGVEVRWVDAYFPFTHPSWELEILFQGEWLEVLGCGVTEQKVVANSGATDRAGWAFGLGLERLAMVLFGIPDIRLFWSEDSRFISQFHDGDLTTQFKAFSKCPPATRDISFWISPQYSLMNFSEIVRSTAGDLVEQIDLVDEFKHPKTGRESHMYRITYRSMERPLQGDEVNAIQERVREQLVSQLGVQLR